MRRVRSGVPPLFVLAALLFPHGLTAAQTQALRAGNDFGFELLRRLHAERSDDAANVFISPLSLSMSLGMLLNAAGGETFNAMGDALGLNGLLMAEANDASRALAESLLRLDPTVEFRLANASWFEEGIRIRRDYRSRVQETFGARLETVRFKEPDVADAINGWVDTATEGRIADLVSAQDFRGMVALLVNTIYFKGGWTDPFDPVETAAVDFRQADGSTVRVPMMWQALDARVAGGVGSGEDFAVVDLPYGGRSFSMMVVVPIGDATLAGLVEEMDGERHGGIAQLEGPQDQLLRMRGSVQEGEAGMAVELDIGRGRGGGSTHRSWGFMAQGSGIRVLFGFRYDNAGAGWGQRGGGVVVLAGVQQALPPRPELRRTAWPARGTRPWLKAGSETLKR